MTAVIVAHDGVTWLPHVADAVLGQTRPVQRVVAVDTGSQDRSGAVLASKFGQANVFGMDRPTGYGSAIARALQHRAAKTPVPAAVGSGGSSPWAGQAGGQAGERTEWLWLLHDDCEPAPDALEQLLRGTVETSAAAVLGPKIRDWNNREVILEAGVTVDSATRRVTGIEPREVDQGQHDGDRDTLAVSSAGMLVRRDVWEQVGGFDAAMGLFMDDVDFCWRVHAAGYRVRVITDAVVYHVQAATKHKRRVSLGRRVRMLERRNGLLTLLGNLPGRPMLAAAAGNIAVSFLRIAFFLLAKRVAAAVDELSAVVSVMCHPIRLIRMRSNRARGRRAAYSRVRADLPPGHSGRKVAEFVLAAMSKSQADTAGSHHATEDPSEDDSMLVDNGLGKRLLTSPTLVTFVLLTGVSLAACRSLIGTGPLGGGSLVPAWGGSGTLWASYVQTFHPAGIGSTTPAPPWLAIIAALATVLGGKPWLAMDVLLIGCVPLAGMSAMFAVRKITTSGLVQVWASVTYALLPVAMGVIAAGRFGAAVAFVLLPVIVAQAGRMMTQSGPRATRAAWATGLLLALSAAFVPLLWVIAVLACVLAAFVFRLTKPGLLRNLAVVAITPPVLLMPWALTLISNPSGLLLEAGLPQSGPPAFSLPARSLMLLSPGGPGLPPYWVTGGLLAVAFAALFAGRRRRLVVAGWCVALCGLLAGVVVSHLIVRPADGSAVTVWAGLPLALAATGLLIAVAAAADGLSRRAGGPSGWRNSLGLRGPLAVVLGLVACSAPALAAASWLSHGVSGPVHRVSSPLVPALVAAADGQHRQVRTLVLTSSGDHISYLLLRGPSPSLADSALTPPADAQRALSKVVSTLTTPGGNLAANQTQLLAEFDIGFVLAQAPVDVQLSSELSSISGLRLYSMTGRYWLWQLDTPPARVTIRKPGGSIVPVPSGAIGVSGTAVPAGGGTLMLAEPAGGWRASVDGHALAAVPSPAGSWAQAFRLPSSGGTLSVGHSGLTRDLLLILELVLFVVVAALALPGIHVAEQEATAETKREHPGRRSAARASGHRSSAIPAQRVAGGAGAAGLSRACSGRAVAEMAGARTAVLDRDEGAVSERTTGRGAGGRGLSGHGASPGDGDEIEADAGADAAAGRRKLSKAGRGTRGRGSRGRDARQRTGMTKGSRAAEAATGRRAAGDDQEDDAQTTMLAAESGAGGRSSRDAGRRGRRDGGRSDGGRSDGGRSDGGRSDGGRSDGGRRDGGRSDGGRSDGGRSDGGRSEGGRSEGGRSAGGRREGGRPDAVPADRGAADRGRADRGRADSGRADSELADSELADGRGREGRLADAWPYEDSNPSGSPLADAWPYRGGGSGDSAPPGGQHGYRSDEDFGGDPLAPGWPGASLARGRSYRDQAPYDLPGRGSGEDPDYDLDYGQARPAAGWQSPSGRSPSGQSPSGRLPSAASPGGHWPSSELDAPRGGDYAAGGRSPSAHAPDDSWPGLDTSGGRTGSVPDGDNDLPPWRTDQGTRAYRVSGPGTGPQRAVTPRDDLPGGAGERTGRGRHGARRPDEVAGWGDGGGGELEPLPPLNGPGRGHDRRSPVPDDEDTGGWARFDEAEDQRWNPAPDYEPEYEGDSW